MDVIYDEGKNMITYILLTLFIILALLYIKFSLTSQDALDAYHLISENDLRDEEKKEQDDDKKITLSLEQKFMFPFITALLLLLSLLFLDLSSTNIIFCSVFSIAGAYIFVRILANREKKQAFKKYDFYLPIVMERLVMAVQGGNDVYAAVSVVVNLGKKNVDKIDPVTKLLDVVLKKNKSGISFEDSLSLVASSINLTSIRHAFLHLGIAQREGGEIISPMEELSDSTQEYYQQIVEKEIAVMPVKATLPLLCAFVGLIIFFMSVPVVQIMNINTHRNTSVQTTMEP